MALTATQLKEKFLGEAAAFDADAYREDIRGLADKYGVKYKEDYEEELEKKQFGTENKSSKKAIFISIALFLIVAGGVSFYYFKKVKK